MSNEKYYVDRNGHLWKGYIELDDNLHYARFAGLTNPIETGISRPIWIFERSEIDVSWCYIGDVPNQFII